MSPARGRPPADLAPPLFEAEYPLPDGGRVCFRGSFLTLRCARVEVRWPLSGPSALEHLAAAAREAGQVGIPIGVREGGGVRSWVRLVDGRVEITSGAVGVSIPAAVLPALLKAREDFGLRCRAELERVVATPGHPVHGLSWDADFAPRLTTSAQTLWWWGLRAGAGDPVGIVALEVV